MSRSEYQKPLTKICNDEAKWHKSNHFHTFFGYPDFFGSSYQKLEPFRLKHFLGWCQKCCFRGEDFSSLSMLFCRTRQRRFGLKRYSLVQGWVLMISGTSCDVGPCQQSSSELACNWWVWRMWCKWWIDILPRWFHRFQSEMSCNCWFPIAVVEYWTESAEERKWTAALTNGALWFCANIESTQRKSVDGN